MRMKPEWIIYDPGVHSSGSFVALKSWLIVMLAGLSAPSFVKGQFLSSPRDVKVKWYEKGSLTPFPKGAQGELKQRPQEKDIKDLQALSSCLVQFPKITPKGRMDIKITTVDLMILN